MIRRAADDLDPAPVAAPGVDPDGSTLSPGPPPAGPAGAVDRDERLGEAIEEYLEQAEGGVPPDPETFARGYPDLGDDLLAALEGLALVKGLVGGPSGPGHRLEEGRRVAGYRIVRELGRGGMGIVYEAVHVGLDRPVALKVLGSQAAPDSSGRRRFLNEARTAAGLHHTHIVPVFDVGQVGGLCYYAMQRIEGSGLDRVLRALRRDRSVASGSTTGSSLRAVRPGPLAGAKPASPAAGLADAGPGPASALGDETLSWGGGDLGAARTAGKRWPGDDEADAEPMFVPPRGSNYYRWVADVGRQAAEALAHAHQRGIIHRDIKPSNLLVDARGVIWVADFGLARRLADPSQTQVDSLLGTPRYMSPEQARTGAIDGRADVYSLGATLYELVTLRPPFDGQTAAELIDQIATREPGRPRKFDPKVPLDLETILLKALAKRPADRYAGAAELADDLARFLAHEPVRARRIGPLGRTWRFARRHPGASTVSVLAASVVLTTATVAYVRIKQARDRANVSAAEARQARDVAEDYSDQLADKNDQLAEKVLEAIALLIQGKEEQATIVLHSTAPKRRSIGLDLVRQAATLGQEADPARLVRLRDQAIAFMSLRDVEDGAPIPSPDEPRRGLIFGPNSQRIAALTDDGQLGVWNVTNRDSIAASAQPIAPLRRAWNGRNGNGRPPLPGERIAMAGDQFIVVQPDEGGVCWFDMAAPTGEGEKFPIKGQQVVTVLAAADGRHFLTIGPPSPPARPAGAERGEGRPERGEGRPEAEEPRIWLWDREHPEGPRATLSFPAPQGEVRFAPFFLGAIAPDGSKIAAARFAAPEVMLWDGEGRSLGSVPIQGGATALALGPVGQLAVASNGGEVSLWDLSLPRPRPLPGLNFHHSFINFLRFGPGNASMLAAASEREGGVELWDLATHTPIATLKTAAGVTDLAFAPDGRTLAAGQPSAIALWSLLEPTAQTMLPESGDFPLALAFGPGDVLAIASNEPNTYTAAPLRLWGGPGQCPPSIVSWPRLRPTTVGFDTAGRMYAADLEALRWFQPPRPEPVVEVALPPARPGGGRGNPNPRILARTPAADAMVITRRDMTYLWRAADPAALPRLKPRDSTFPEGYSRGPYAAAALAPDARTLYHLAAVGRQVVARPIQDGEILPPVWTASTAQATMLILSPDGKTLAVGNHAGEVELRAAADGSLAGPPAVPDDDAAGPVEALAFSPDSRMLAVGGREQVRLWGLGSKPLPLLRLPGHRGSVRLLAFDSGGGRLAGADEKTIKVWDIARLRDELGRLGLGW